MISSYQARFTGGRRLEENLFVRYCIEEIYRLGRELVVVSVDFEKAFDGVEGEVLVRALKYYKCDPRLHWIHAGSGAAGRDWIINC